jgi:hypothetical protein
MCSAGTFLSRMNSAYTWNPIDLPEKWPHEHHVGLSVLVFRTMVLYEPWNLAEQSQE